MPDHDHDPRTDDLREVADRHLDELRESSDSPISTREMIALKREAARDEGVEFLSGEDCVQMVEQHYEDVSEKRPKHKLGGRPTKLTPELVELVAECTRKGLTIRESASLCRIHESTWTAWMKRAEKAKTGVFAELYIAIRAAEAESIAAGFARLEMMASRAHVEVKVTQREMPDGTGYQEKVTTVRPPLAATTALLKMQLKRQAQRQAREDAAAQKKARPAESLPDAGDEEDPKVIRLHKLEEKFGL